MSCLHVAHDPVPTLSAICISLRTSEIFPTHPPQLPQKDSKENRQGKGKAGVMKHTYFERKARPMGVARGKRRQAETQGLLGPARSEACWLLAVTPMVFTHQPRSGVLLLIIRALRVYCYIGTSVHRCKPCPYGLLASDGTRTDS